MSSSTTADLVEEWMRLDQVRADSMLTYLGAKARGGHWHN
jgi:hypothetical protein